MSGKQGFGSMDKELVRQIASKGGKSAHAMGVAHQYNSQTGKEAGRKGGSTTRCGPDDPRIPLIKDAIAKNPRFTRHQCHQSFGVSRPTLDRWVAEGLIPKPYAPTNKEQTAHWRKVK